MWLWSFVCAPLDCKSCFLVLIFLFFLPLNWAFNTCSLSLCLCNPIMMENNWLGCSLELWQRKFQAPLQLGVVLYSLMTSSLRCFHWSMTQGNMEGSWCGSSTMMIKMATILEWRVMFRLLSVVCDNICVLLVCMWEIMWLWSLDSAISITQVYDWILCHTIQIMSYVSFKVCKHPLLAMLTKE